MAHAAYFCTFCTQAVFYLSLGDSVEQLLKDVPEIANNFTVISKIGTGQCSTSFNMLL